MKCFYCGSEMVSSLCINKPDVTLWFCNGCGNWEVEHKTKGVISF